MVDEDRDALVEALGDAGAERTEVGEGAALDAAALEQLAALGYVERDPAPDVAGAEDPVLRVLRSMLQRQ